MFSSFKYFTTRSTVCTPLPPIPSLFSREKGGGLSLQTIFQKGWGYDRISIFRGSCWERGGCSFYIKNKLKSEICNNRKFLHVLKCFFSVITKNLNWKISTKNLVAFKTWDGVKDEKFYIMWVHWKIQFLERGEGFRKKLI